jgi:mono/diheme cytochrome c family protein
MAIGSVPVCGSLTASGAPLAIPGVTNTSINLLHVLDQKKPLPDGLLVWDGDSMRTNIPADSGSAHFIFNFTNISLGPVMILDVQPSCGCTTVQLPSPPWKISPGHSGKFGVTVHLLGKARKQTKYAYVQTDKGFKVLTLELNILPPVFTSQSAADRSHALYLAKIDRQAVFLSDCATCHLKTGESQDGKTLYYALCSICHEGKDRTVTKTDLYAIKTPTNVVFWIDWIAHSKSGSLMPAFSTSAGGPLSEMQIANIARYLNTTDEIDPP